jgi:aryl-alcohol dehydrogenase-like predicted oxidoreductase
MNEMLSHKKIKGSHTSVKHISIGGLDVSRIGLGAMSMSGYHNIGAGSDAESIRAIHRALDLGVTHLDTAEIYGPYTNEELVGRAIKGRRNQVVLATKFGIISHSGSGPGVASFFLGRNLRDDLDLPDYGR